MFNVIYVLECQTMQKKNKTSKSFEVYWDHHTHEELLRLVYGILDQILPTVKRALYEDVDGEKPIGSSSLDPEDSHLLPGTVQMHRQANTSDKNTVLIKNHFNRTDFVDLSNDIDLNLKYSESTFVNKSNGMVTESRSHFAELLNFGEPIHNNSGFGVSSMKITLHSHVSLMESKYSIFTEFERFCFHQFVKLVVPKSKAAFSVKENPDVVSNSSQAPLNISSPSQPHNVTNPSGILPKRSRRAVTAVPWKKAGPLYLNIEHPFTVFEKKVIGINVKGNGRVWLSGGDAMEIGVGFELSIGPINLPEILQAKYKKHELEDGSGRRTGFKFEKGIVSVCSESLINYSFFVLSGTKIDIVNALNEFINHLLIR